MARPPIRRQLATQVAPSQARRRLWRLAPHSLELGDHIYYPLLHRLASAVHEAGRFGATSAGLLVHSFSPEKAGFGAYREFVELFGIEAGQGELVRLGQPKGVSILCGWAQGVGAGS